LTQVDLEIDNGSMIPYYENMEYDGIGNILGYSANREVSRHYSFSYDDARFPILPTDIEITGSQPLRETFTYDHSGSRIQRELDGDNNPATANEISYFIPFGTENLAELDGRGRVRRAYSFAGGERTGYKAAGRTVLYLKDHLGSTKMTLDLYASTLQEGLQQRAGDADPYGVTWRESYAATAESEPHQYTGQEREAALDLYYYGARFYDPELGRFSAVDPAREFANPYSYVGNNPVSRLDPTGMEWTCKIIKNKEGATEVQFIFTGVVAADPKTNISMDQLRLAAERIEDGARRSFSQYFGGYLYSIKVQLRVGEVADAGETDHLILFLNDDDPLLHGHPARVNELGGLDIYMGRRFLMTDSPGGDYEEMGLTANGKETIERTVAHEMGHTAGFTHDDAYTKTLEGKLKLLNGMPIPIPYHLMMPTVAGKARGIPGNQIGFFLNQSFLVDMSLRIGQKNWIEINKTRR
jgi:RHS repeat-associated protein